MTDLSKHTRGNRSPTYRSWGAMVRRCTNPNTADYEWYGGRGIKVCERWRTFANFLADMSVRPKGKTLDRINTDGDYEPGNCRWATPKQQARSRRKRKPWVLNPRDPATGRFLGKAFAGDQPPVLGGLPPVVRAPAPLSRGTLTGSTPLPKETRRRMKSVNEVAKISDPMKRLAASALLVRQAEAKIETLRNRRNLAILVMLRPFADAVADTNAARATLRSRRDAGEITEAEYEAGLSENREQRQKDLRAANVTIYPVTIYKMLGVVRSLVNRILMRMPDGDLPTMSDPAKAARNAHRQLPQYEKILRDARIIRDDAALSLIEGASGAPVSNAEIARTAGLTTARIAQLREAG